MLEKVGHKVKKEKKWDTRSEERKQRKEEVGHEVNKIKKEKKKCRKKKKGKKVWEMKLLAKCCVEKDEGTYNNVAIDFFFFWGAMLSLITTAKLDRCC